MSVDVDITVRFSLGFCEQPVSCQIFFLVTRNLLVFFNGFLGISMRWLPSSFQCPQPHWRIVSCVNNDLIILSIFCRHLTFHCSFTTDFYNPLKADEDEEDTVVQIMYPFEPPVGLFPPHFP